MVHENMPLRQLLPLNKSMPVRPRVLRRQAGSFQAGRPGPRTGPASKYRYTTGGRIISRQRWSVKWRSRL